MGRTELKLELIEAINKKYQADAFYLLYTDVFEENYFSFKKAGQKYYQNIQIGYSYKTNYLPCLCKLVQKWGGYAEVVSSMEYELAYDYYQIDGNRIIVNGPIHTKDFIYEVLNNGSLLQIDSMYILEYVKEFCLENPHKDINVTIRFNFSMQDAHFSRFGFDYTLENITHIKNILISCSNLNIQGFHCHFSTGKRSVAAFKERAEKLIQIYKKHFLEQNLKYLNFGGGFFSRMPQMLKEQFECSVPAIEEYTEALGKTMIKEFGNQSLELIVEPGTALTADCMIFVCQVYDVKEIAGRKIALTNGSIHNIKPTLNTKNLPCYVVKKRKNRKICEMPYYITGYTCMEKDVMFEDYIGDIEKGDYIVFENIGAYTNVYKPPFIKAQVPIISINKLNNTSLEKRGETTENIMKTYNNG